MYSRSVGERFDLAKPTLSKFFQRVVKCVNNLAPTIITWPRGGRVRNRIARHFETFSRMPDCIGAVDGTYVEIKAPKEDPQSYVTRKCNYAFTLQAVAEPSLQFTDVYTGWPGSVSDCRIFKNSDLYHNVCADVDRYFERDQYILGDKAYPTLPWCIPPYVNRGNLTAAQTYFNTVHAKTRQVIERAFALLFGRFRRLKYLDMNCTAFIPATILAACVLHNVCLEFRDDNMEDYIRDGINHVLHEEDELVGRDEIMGAGRLRRDVLCGQMFAARRREV